MRRRPKIALESLDIFRELRPAERKPLAARCEWRDYLPSQTIVCAGDATDCVFLLASGHARASIYSTAGQEIMLRDIRAGEMFSEITPIDGRPRRAHIVATRRSTVATLPAGVLWEIIRREPQVATLVLQRLARLVRMLSDRIYAVNALSVRERVLAELRLLAEPTAAEGGRAVIDPAPTHLDMAGRVVAKRETVSREMAQLARAGVIERRGRKLVIPDLARLRTGAAAVLAAMASAPL